MEVDGHGIAGGEGDLTEVGDDEPLVLHARGHQEDEALIGDLDATLVDHGRLAGAGYRAEVELPVEEVLVRDTEGRGEQARDIDTRALAENDPIGVEQEDLAVGDQLPQNRRGVDARDAVQGHSALSGLYEPDELIDIDAEPVPVDDGAIAGLIDDGLDVVGLGDGRIAPNHSAARGRRPNLNETQ